MKYIDKIVNLYESEPVNITLKCKNFLTLLLVLFIVCVVLFPVCLIAGKTSVLPIIFVILSFCVLSYILLKYKKITISFFAFFTLLGLLPFFLALSQESQTYRDIYLYFFFCAPFFVLSAIAGYEKRQILMVGIFQIVFAYVYTFIRVVNIPNIQISNIIFCLIIGTAFHIMITAFLIVNLKLEDKVIAILNEGKKQTEDQLIQLQNLVNQIATILDSVQTVTKNLGVHTNAATGTMDKVKEINNSINKISSEAKHHSTSVNQLSSAIEKTKEVFKKNMISVDKLKQSAKDVFNVISVIEDVTEQTNLLAINASIEASHAGEFGKGFIVVANEIKTLAEKTTDNSKKIKEMLDITNDDLHEVDLDMKKTVGEFENITSVADTVNFALSSILDGSSKVAYDASQISDIIADLIDILKVTNSEMAEIGRRISDSTMAFGFLD